MLNWVEHEKCFIISGPGALEHLNSVHVNDVILTCLQSNVKISNMSSLHV